ncbi:FadR/GntR family transcriptional regulator [Streptomyces sp. VRA16 Mangrove soil]|uniref:FadR/GntR family transcriptional regulator n=1 Tax=Streptomyces sp. VRA16 Mangrove soil TaxID=2817434 RepID=UPI001A9EE94A|nr:FCD domain-containing protein [Streptomyces sp. VRA16 Mangrove soil]MBO1332247.1 FadR family transcriptional regulator [Streptomyces sp. VRA16 Mangrove soil]
MVSYAGRGVHGDVVEALGSRVVGGAAPVGATLDPRDLGAEFDVSLTVIREALKVLAGKGLVASRQKRGTFVRPRADWNVLDADVIRWRVEGGEARAVLRDLAEMRAIVEPAAVRRAAEWRTGRHLADLEAALERMARAGDDAAEAVAADSDFHRALLAASGNEMLAMLHALTAPALRARDSIVHGPHGSADDPVPSHRAVLDAIRDGAAERAGAAMARLLAQADRDAHAAVRERA